LKFRKNAGRLFPADDWASWRSLQKSYREIHPRLPGTVRNKAARFSFHLIGWGVMEAAIRNIVRKRVLCCMCGAFSDKWLDVARRCGKDAEALQVEWGKTYRPESHRPRVGEREIDAVTLIHNETSTGVMNPLPEICCTLAKYPTSRSSSIPSRLLRRPNRDGRARHRRHAHRRQKALALPPGFSLFSVSEKAFACAEKQKDRGLLLRFSRI